MLASLVHARHVEPLLSRHPPRAAPWGALSPHPTMALEPGPEALLDLSFLTEEERGAIAEVLRRDWQLRRREEGRISKLRKSLSDPALLRTLTGDWFCDARAQRHRHHLGSDLVRASIRRRRRPRGAGELERGPSLGELETIGEPLVEEKEDEDGVAELEESPPMEEAPAAAEPQPSPTATLEGTPVSQPPRQGDIPTREQDIPFQSGNHDGGVRGGSVYIKTYLLPDKSNRSKRKTTVRKRSLDPIFNETLKYKLEKRDLQGRTLNLSVWHHDSLGRNLFLGEVEIALGTWDWANTSPEWFNLQPRMPISSDGLTSRGNLNLALKFIPAGSEGGGLPPTGELHIWVKDAQSLIPLQSGTVDAFVQCYVLPDDSKASRQKTRVVKRSLNPLFNHTMVYDGFQAKDLAEACAEFTLWHHEAFSKRQLGGIRLSLGTGSSYGLAVGWMDSTAEERGVWGRLLQQPGQWVEALLPLRTNLVPRA
ncbi:PREDICTED: synaptotagmin-like protein 1 [Calidris pugnax]|uniref:synaptotagmin-like protein 1 n=1 Tax=Calidris pugnax TaxID=198806 RepID=UPI00071D5750|nr:PREDICTED: synaptotagmin-like protein 1 [Calidris pugnax]